MGIRLLLSASAVALISVLVACGEDDASGRAEPTSSARASATTSASPSEQGTQAVSAVASEELTCKLLYIEDPSPVQTVLDFAARESSTPEEVAAAQTAVVDLARIAATAAPSMAVYIDRIGAETQSVLDWVAKGRGKKPDLSLLNDAGKRLGYFCADDIQAAEDAAAAASAAAVAAQAHPDIVCWWKGNNLNEKGYYRWDTMEEAWKTKSSDCLETKLIDGTLTPTQQQAMVAAYGEKAKPKSLGTLYGICAENDAGWLKYMANSESKSQIREIQAVLLICPDHPQAAKAQGYLQSAQAIVDLVEQGRIFYDGTYRVGKGVAPGTYYSEPDGDGCYWERTDAAGDIIDNNFSNGLRVEMTVYASDYSITVNNCGKWQPVP